MMDRPGLPAVKLRRIRTAAARLIARHERKASFAIGALILLSWVAMAAVLTVIMLSRGY